MIDTIPQEILQPAIATGLRNQKIPLSERLAGQAQTDIQRLKYLTILNQAVSLYWLGFFFEKCDTSFLDDEDALSWIINSTEKGFIEVKAENDLYFLAVKDLYAFFSNEIGEEQRTEYHLAADRYFFDRLKEIAVMLKIDLPKDQQAQRNFIIGSAGFLDTMIHLPQARPVFKTGLGLAVGWQEHLFWLKKFDEMSDLANSSCFALAREGDQKLAQSLLTVAIDNTKGLKNLISRANLATLLRQDSQLNLALRIYKSTIVGLIRRGAFRPLVIVYSEMGTIYEQKGNLFKAAITLEICCLMHAILKNKKSQAIAYSHLASVYRYAKLYGLALMASKYACEIFRKEKDYLNLGRALLTRGNIFYNLRAPNKALDCFNESLLISQQTSDTQAIAGALSGKARVMMFQNNLIEVKDLLDESISLRQRYSNHLVGIEYQNMGYYYEMSNNFQMALVWYQKALKDFQQYMPIEAAGCEQKIRKIEKQIESTRSRS